MGRPRTVVLCIALSAVAWVAPAGPDGSAAISAAATAPSVGQTASHDIVEAAVRRTVDDLGRPGGFYLTPKYHIPLPDALDPVVKTLADNYAAMLPVAVERSINRAAEATAPAAGDFILKNLPGITLPEPVAGPGDALSVALRARIKKSLREAMRPVMSANLTQVGGDAALRSMQSRYEALVAAPMPKFDVEDYALDKFVDAFFACLAEEEDNIRTRPSLRTTDALRRIFTH